MARAFDLAGIANTVRIVRVKIVKRGAPALPVRRFRVTLEESYWTNILGKIRWTPPDFRDAARSIL
jgi:hypothetical protein